MKYNFDEIIERRGTSSLKWDNGEMLKTFLGIQKFDDNSIPIFTADMDLPTSNEIVSALHKTVDQRIFGYTSHQGTPEYFEAIQRWFRDKHKWEIAKEDILYVNGTVEAVKTAIMAYTNEGDGILINRPIYGPFTWTIEETSRQVINSQLQCTEGYYTIDYDDFEKHCKQDHVKLFILCNPHNPTGRVWKEEELKKIAQICEANNVIVISDEVHCDILRKGVKFVPYAQIGDPKNTVVLNAINKTFNLAGLHCSHAIIKDEDLKQKYSDALGMRMPSPFAVSACIAAYTQSDEWYEEVLTYIDETYDWVLDFLKVNMPKVKVVKPEGTYVLWMDFSAYGMSRETIKHKIYDEANVILESGTMFDPDGSEFFERVCLPSPRLLIKEAFERIAKAFE